MDALRELEVHAYTTVLKAFMAGPVDEWDREEVMTKLRALWQIDNDVHMDVIRQLKQDPELAAIREGRAAGRPLRGKSFKLGSQALPSLVGAHSLPGAVGAAGWLLRRVVPSRRPLTAERTAAAVGQAGAAATGLPPSPFDRPTSPQQGAGSVLSSDSTRQQRAPAAAQGAKAGSAWAPPSQPPQQGGRGPKKQSGGLMTAPSMQARRGPGRPSLPAGLVRAASTRQQRPTRPRSSSLTGAGDPRGFLGRRCWRLWPSESPPWVEGVVYEYDPESETYTILYDPNTDPDSGHPETMEAQYGFTNAEEYVLCEKIDFLTMPGSRRQYERPTPDNPPPPLPLPLITGAPSKKRKSLAPSALAAPVPQHAPFDPAYLAQRLQLAGEEELGEMVVVLERREQALVGELVALDAQGVTDADLAKRAELERQLAELGDREYDLMAELAKLRDVEL